MANPTANDEAKRVNFAGLGLTCDQVLDGSGNVIVDANRSSNVADSTTALATITAAKAAALVLSNLEDGSANNTLESISTLTDYVPHASGAVAVTSNAGTDLDTTASALETFRDEQDAHNLSISRSFDKMGDEVNALTTLTSEVHDDHATIKTDLETQATKINAILDILEERGLMTA